MESKNDSQKGELAIKQFEQCEGTIPVSQDAYVPRSSLASASICSCAFWGRSWSGFINWVNGKAGEREVPVRYRTTTLYRVFGWTFSEFPLQATGRPNTLNNKRGSLIALGAKATRCPNSIWKTSFQASNHVVNSNLILLEGLTTEENDLFSNKTKHCRQRITQTDLQARPALQRST